MTPLLSPVAFAVVVSLGCMAPQVSREVNARTGAPQGAAAPGWRPLFNGQDLSGWETFLAGRGPKRPVEEWIGVDRDPLGVFRVVTVDGRPAIRVSGEIWGALTTREAFTDYHLRLEFKWGKKKWPPRDRAPRDSGICYHSVGPYGAGSLVWKASIEAQIQEQDCGDFYSVGDSMVDVEADQVEAEPSSLVYRPGAPLRPGTRRRVRRSDDAEKPAGQWNLMEVLAVGNTSVHVVNGKVVMVLGNPRRLVEGKIEFLTGGQIQLQSEGAEIFFRRIEIRPLRTMPPGVLR